MIHPIRFNNPEYIAIVSIIVIFVALIVLYGLLKRRKELKSFGALSHQRRCDFSLSERILTYKSIALVIGFILLGITLLRPLWGHKDFEVFEKDRDIIFVLDISRSMSATDVRPNRLDAARRSIENTIPSIVGVKVALVTFAGSAEIRCPITDDYEFFLQTLANATPDSAVVGGSFLNSALEKVSDKLLDQKRQGKQEVIVISDGGDFITKSFDKICSVIKAKGARLTIIGLGDPSYESRIPLNDVDFLKYKGEVVKTKLDGKLLKEVAFKAGGLYIEIGTSVLDMKSIISTLISSESLKLSDDKPLNEYKDRFQIFLLFALLIFIYWAYPIQVGRTILGFAIIFVSMNTYGENAESFYSKGNYSKAAELFGKDISQNSNNKFLLYNFANSLQKSGEHIKAYNTYESLLANLDNGDVDFGNRIIYDMAIIAISMSEKALELDAVSSNFRNEKSLELIRFLLSSGVANENILNAFQYSKNLSKKINAKLDELKKREAEREKIKESLKNDLKKLIEEQRIINDLSKNINNLFDISEKEKKVVESVKILIEKISKEAKTEGKTVDTIKYVTSMNKALAFLKEAVKNANATIENVDKKNIKLVAEKSFATLVNLAEALLALDDNNDNSDVEDDENVDLSIDEMNADEDDEYKDSSSSDGDLNSGNEVQSLPMPEQLEGEILKSEKENLERREQNRGKYIKMEKDW